MKDELMVSGMEDSFNDCWGGEGKERTILNEKGLNSVNKREIVCFEEGWEMLVMKLMTSPMGLVARVDLRAEVLIL